MTIFFLFFILFKSTKTADRAAEESAGDDREARRALHGETSAAGQVRRGRREWRQAKQGRQSESREQPPPQEQDAQRQTAQGVAQPRRPNPSKTADAIFFSFLFFFFFDGRICCRSRAELRLCWLVLQAFGRPLNGRTKRPKGKYLKYIKGITAQL